MLCREVKRVIYFFLDGSLGENKKSDVDSHLKLCHDCEERARFQQRLREFIQQRTARLNLRAPERLRTRLNRSVRAFRNEWARPDGVFE